MGGGDAFLQRQRLVKPNHHCGVYGRKQGHGEVFLKGPSLMGLMEEIYRPIFGSDIMFYRTSGKSFMEEAIKNPTVSAAVFFGSDEHVLPYQEAFRKSAKKADL